MQPLKRNPIDLVRPSSSHGWLECHGRPFMEAQFEDSDSVYAMEGTFAHMVAEKRLLNGDDFILAGAEYDEGTVTAEMDEAVQRYVDYIRELPGELFVEHEVPFKDLGLLPNNGTSDAVVIDWENSKAVINDLKYGKTIVYAERNTQMMLYALGVLHDFEYLGELEYFELIIHQPRLDWVDSWTITRKELLEWYVSVVEPAKEAIEQVDEENVLSHLTPGSHCDKFCSAKAHCAAFAEHNIEAVSSEFLDAGSFTISEPGQISINEFGELLGRVDEIKKWCEALKARAVADLTAGVEVPGWKLVAGRSTRKWRDETEVMDLLKGLRSFKADDYAPRKLMTAPALEKVLGKEKFSDKLGEFVVKPPGAPTLAPESDKRPSVVMKDDFEFENQNGETENVETHA